MAACVARVTNAGMLPKPERIFEKGYPVVTYVSKLNEMKHLLTLAALLLSKLLWRKSRRFLGILIPMPISLLATVTCFQF